MRQRAPLPRVLRVGRHGEVGGARDGLDGADVDRVLVHVLQPDAVAVDVFPGFGRVEGELVGHDAHDGAVDVVVEFVVEGDAAAQQGDDGWDGRDAP